MTREAELGLEIARLRAVLKIARKHVGNDTDFGVFGSEKEISEFLQSIRIDENETASLIDATLSTPPSTTALQELIEKVERRTIERCERLCLRPVNWLHPNQQKIADEIKTAIRALPTGNLKLEDLK